MKKVLFVSYTDFIKNTFTGGQKASQRNYQMNVAIFGEENVDVILFDREITETRDGHFICVKSSSSKINTFLSCFQGYARGYTKRCEKAILKQLRQEKYDYIYIDFSGYGISLKKIRAIFKGIIITFFHDPEYLYELNRAKHDSKFYYLSAWAIRKAEKIAVKYSDYLIALNSRDHKLIQKIYNREPDIDLPISFQDIVDENRLFNEKSEGYLLFVGSDFGPNVDGLRWFIEKIMPNVTKTLKIVGKGMERYKNEMTHNNVEVVGTVEDLSDYYYKAECVVLPIRYGDGMKVKTAEALMYGRTVIGTNEAFEGYEIKDSFEGYRCNTAEEFITRINNLKESGYNVNSRKLFMDKHNLYNTISIYKNLLKTGEQE